MYYNQYPDEAGNSSTGSRGHKIQMNNEKLSLSLTFLLLIKPLNLLKLEPSKQTTGLVPQKINHT